LTTEHYRPALGVLDAAAGRASGPTGAGTPARMPRRRPLPDEVRDLIIEELIASDTVPPGRLLPPEKELSERYGVSRITVRAALRSLQEAGLVSIRHGIGTRVLPRSHALTRGLDRLGSIDAFAADAGQPVDTAGLEWDELPATAAQAERLGVAIGHPVLIVMRVKLIGGTPAGWLIDVVPEGRLAFDVIRAEFAGSILDVLLAHPEAGIEYADAEVTPVNMTTAIARRLNAKRGDAALLIDAVAYTADGEPVELAQSWLLPANLRFSVRRRPPLGL
jgi:DNA-binding GntR family transcriptional regulator